MNNELIILVGVAVVGLKISGFKLSEEQETKMTKILNSEEFKKVENSFPDNSEGDSKLVDAAIAYLEENL